MDRLEILIDNLLIYLPSDTPVSGQFDRATRGSLHCVWAGCSDRAFGGLDVVGSVANDFFGQQPQPVNDKTPPIELSEPVDNDNMLILKQKLVMGLVSLKNLRCRHGENGESPALVSIEQEMLAVRRLYMDGHVIKDVYVSETRRLYAKAQAVKSSQPE